MPRESFLRKGEKREPLRRDPGLKTTPAAKNGRELDHRHGFEKASFAERVHQLPGRVCAAEARRDEREGQHQEQWRDK